MASTLDAARDISRVCHASKGRVVAVYNQPSYGDLKVHKPVRDGPHFTSVQVSLKYMLTNFGPSSTQITSKSSSSFLQPHDHVLTKAAFTISYATQLHTT